MLKPDLEYTFAIQSGRVVDARQMLLLAQTFPQQDEQQGDSEEESTPDQRVPEREYRMGMQVTRGRVGRVPAHA
ncbi:MAG: hypothetical protein ABI389_02980 [Rhodanobacter sp.]